MKFCVFVVFKNCENIYYPSSLLSPAPPTITIFSHHTHKKKVQVPKIINHKFCFPSTFCSYLHVFGAFYSRKTYIIMQELSQELTNSINNLLRRSVEEKPENVVLFLAEELEKESIC